MTLHGSVITAKCQALACLLELSFPSGPLENAAGPTMAAPLLSCLCEGRPSCGEQISRKEKGRGNHISEGTTAGIQVPALKEAQSAQLGRWQQQR